MKNDLSRLISIVRLKVRLITFLNWLLELLIYASVLYILGYFFHFDVPYIYLIVPLSMALGLSLFKPINDESIAIIIDRDLDLKERVITSLEFSDKESPIIERLIDETIILLKSLDIKKVYPFKFRKRIRYAILIPPILFLSLMFYQNVFYPRFVSPKEEISVQNRIETDILKLEQKLISEKPELAKRLEFLRRGIEEKKIKGEEGLSILKEITKEIEKDPGSIDTTSKVDIKKMLEMVMNKMSSNTSSQDSKEGTREGERQLAPSGNLSTEDSSSEDRNFPLKDKSALNPEKNSGENSSMGGENFDTMPNTTGDKKMGNKVGSRSSRGETETGSKEGERAEESRGSDSIEQGGTLPGKGERDTKLGEESKRLNTQGLPQYVPGIAKEEGDIKLKIKNLGKDTTPSIGERAIGSPTKSSEDPIGKEVVPSEYREAIKLYFERLKGE